MAACCHSLAATTTTVAKATVVVVAMMEVRAGYSLVALIVAMQSVRGSHCDDELFLLAVPGEFLSFALAGSTTSALVSLSGNEPASSSDLSNAYAPSCPQATQLADVDCSAEGSIRCYQLRLWPDRWPQLKTGHRGLCSYTSAVVNTGIWVAHSLCMTRQLDRCNACTSSKTSSAASVKRLSTISRMLLAAHRE